MKKNNNWQNEIAKIDWQINGIYLTIISSILYLIMKYNEKEKIITDLYNLNYQPMILNTDDYDKIIAILLVISDGIFLYSSYNELVDAIATNKKTGYNPSLNSAYNSFYADLLEFSGDLINLYNAFTNDNNVNIPL
jgi:hypothetical protein